jgi:hypothetical protein
VGDDVRAPGRASIEAAFAAVYGPAAPEHRAPPPDQRPPHPGGVVHGISAYRGEDHWHLVTLGLTDLFAKAPGQMAARSGFGHELTLIVPGTDRPPEWAFDLLLGTARVTVTHGRPFHAGARLAPGGPVDGRSSGIVALGLREDPLVVPTAFPFGAYVFLQAVGVSDVEYRLMQRAGTLTVLERLAVKDPLLRTDPARA